MESTFLSLIRYKQFLSWCNDMLEAIGLGGKTLIYVRTFILLFAAILISYSLWWVTRKILIRLIHSFAHKSKTKWDDYLIKNRFFAALAHLVPFLLLDAMIRIVFIDFPNLSILLLRLIDIVVIVISLFVIIRFLSTANDVLSERPSLKDKPIASYFQLSKIVVTCLLVILMISVAFRVDPLVILTSMGALTAIILLVFKDTILGFVGSIQLAANDMIRIGDWVTMEKFGADGDVVEITLATVKIQNFDKTITTIPTYSFISDSFKNWRGMLDSDGRRLMRSINVKIQSVKFCSPELLEKIKEIELIRDYVEKKEEEIAKYNATHDSNEKVLMNGRSQTNIGIFRYYVIKYLEKSEYINNGMTLMVRQLEPTAGGLPLQLYAFTKTQEWAVYEAQIADIFDHLLAAIRFFELEVFENPAGSDMRSIFSGRANQRP